MHLISSAAQSQSKPHASVMLMLVSPRLPQMHSVPLKFTQIISISGNSAQSLQTHLLLLQIMSCSESLNLIHIHSNSYRFTLTHTAFHADSTSIAQILFDLPRLMQIHSACLKLIQNRTDFFRFTQAELIYAEGRGKLSGTKGNREGARTAMSFPI